MTDHIPECPMNTKGSISRCLLCICDALSACEKRLLEGRPDPGISEKQAIANYAIYQNGYASALDAAREAVLGAKAIDVYYGRGSDEPPQFVWLNNAISAIDALREES